MPDKCDKCGVDATGGARLKIIQNGIMFKANFCVRCSPEAEKAFMRTPSDAIARTLDAELWAQAVLAAVKHWLETSRAYQADYNDRFLKKSDPLRKRLETENDIAFTQVLFIIREASKQTDSAASSPPTEKQTACGIGVPGYPS